MAGHAESPAEIPAEIFVEDQPQKQKQGRAIMAWVISGGVHASLILLAMIMVFAAKQITKDTPPTRVSPIAPPEAEKEKPKKERTLEAKVELASETDSTVEAPTSNLDVPQEVSETESDTDSPVSKGREEAISDAETGGTGAFMAIGAGGGGAGMFGSRSGGGRRRAVASGGGSKASEGAVEASLRWFVKHQAPDGAWPLLTYQQNCTDTPKCEPAERHRGPSDDIGVTSLGVLCFLGAGYDHKAPSKHRAVVKKALDWILSMQQPDGEFKIEGQRGHNYAQAMGVMALAEAYGMTADPALRKPVENGVHVMLARRVPANAKGKFPWVWGDFQESSANGMATSSTSWNLQALKGVIGAGLSPGDGWDSGKQWLQAIWEASVRAEGKDPAKLDPYKDETGLAYRYNPATGDISMFRGERGPNKAGTGRGAHDLGCVGLVVGIFQGRQNGDPMIETLANYEMKYHLPTTYPMNNYYVYYDTLGMFQMGGDRWTTWNNTVRDLLVNNQRTGPGCFDGSWDPGVHYSAKETGRPLATALNCLSLEVYYRYAQLKGHAVGAAPAKAH